jgi:U3 small nucleolar RNA-associated protein MPP10
MESESQEEEEEEEEDENVSTGGLEDDFFKLDDLEQFVREGEMEKEDPAFDESELEDDQESQEQNAKFDDFFVNPKEQESEEEQEKIFTKGGMDEYMDMLEDKMVGDKPWQLKGEVQSKGRPVNSLLDSYLDFEVAANPAPLTQTPVVTNEIEDIIKQRILDMNFDDVLPRVVATESRAKTSAEDFMDYEKSKKSLAELYEEDYKKQVLHLPVNTEKEKAKKEATALFRKLCYNLDLLSNLQPTPKPKVVDMEIKSSNVPALVLEEKLPFSVSLEQTKTTREVFDPKETSLKADEELTKSDRNTIRKRHKSALRTRKKEKMRKLIDKMARDPRNGKFEFRKMMKEEKAKKELLERKKTPNSKFSRSSEFFKNFQKLNKEMKSEKEKLEKKSNKKVKV